MLQFGTTPPRQAASTSSKAVRRLSIPDIFSNISQGLQASGRKDGIGLLGQSTSDEFQALKLSLNEGMAKFHEKKAELQAIEFQRDLEKTSETPLPPSPKLNLIQLDPLSRRINQTILEPRSGQFELAPAVNPRRVSVIPPHSMKPNTLRRSTSMSAADFAKNRKPAPVTVAQEILRMNRADLQKQIADPLSPISPTRADMFREANEFSPSVGRKGEHHVMRNNVLNQIDGVPIYKIRTPRQGSW